MISGLKRVVITGLGPVTPIGVGAAAYAEAQRAGRSGIGPITHFDPKDTASKIAGEVRETLDEFVDPREARKLDRYTLLALTAAELAVRDSGLSAEQLRGERTGTLVGSGIGGMKTFEDQARVYVERGAGRISPMFIPMQIANMATGHVAMRYGAMGPSSTVVTACATGTGAIGEAARYIQLGLADVMLAGGAEASVTAMAVGGFSNMKALSTRNDDPEHASRPFSASRDGFVLSEGAGVVVLEEYEHAVKRGATIYAEVVGFGVSADAHHITMPAPEGAGAQLAMKMALRTGGVNPEQVGYVNAHGTSTHFNDLHETQGIKHVFGDHAKKLAVSSTKSMTGHLLGAAGAIEAIAVAQALQDGILPPTINLTDPDPECDLDYVPEGAREAQVEYALSNSFAFGGQNAALLFKRV
ncbi:beta-ketoacyl-ACP synthase II [Deinococcus wulumuqiensis]|uniref:3-oxoacyl-[acyl-carrier-protein] synthase 2 n=1 Tax=Deinococcus wulumuqiensis TaxID=980427 RepID=A0AAV4K4I5_9DEIO|nr:beta-ketoacyl-ACP synthase II [Deinococcus wulumuqiensis]QII19599.1 beta-ketoacyl-ACP synthase II [Deinococcus wulumuqiensis R12]GGI70061.1 3-oxoacyl-[acyl-carrier-protein] synthase 2 [Deinococcus wulumuqiensis]GGP30240.1 3-oxoacyl-[acyl-carrier-protein] synthase 2 [Deinococcus wulumuqiensis]